MQPLAFKPNPEGADPFQVASSLQSILIAFFFIDMSIMLAVGGRLLVAASRTHRAAEAAVGTSAACGALGVILSMISTQVLQRDPDSFPIWALGRIFVAVGVSGLAIGTWRIYRPDTSWAAAASAGVCALAAVGCAIRILPGSIGSSQDGAIHSVFSYASSVAAYGWATIEAFRYHAQLQRRLALGLASPVVAEQFRLWGISGACALGTTAASGGFMYALGRNLSSSPAAFIAVQIALFVASVALWFAFYPPAFYRRRLARRVAA